MLNQKLRPPSRSFFVCASRKPKDRGQFPAHLYPKSPVLRHERDRLDEAADKLAEYRQYASSEGALAHYSASVGVDFSRYGPDEPIRFVQTNALRSNLEAITVRSGGTEWTLSKLLQMMVLGSRQAPIVGSPTRVADELQAWVDEADVDGFNLSRTVIPECVEDFVALVVPELQSRGVMKRAYQPGTLREKLLGPGRARLPASHPAARYRR